MGKKLRCHLGLHAWRPRYEWTEHAIPVVFFSLIGASHFRYKHDECRHCHAQLDSAWHDWREIAGHSCWAMPIASALIAAFWFAPLITAAVLGGMMAFLMTMFGILWACT